MKGLGHLNTMIIATNNNQNTTCFNGLFWLHSLSEIQTFYFKQIKVHSSFLDFPGWNFQVFLRSSSFDLPFWKDVFSFQRREIGALNIHASMCGTISSSQIPNIQARQKLFF